LSTVTAEDVPPPWICSINSNASTLEAELPDCWFLFFPPLPPVFRDRDALPYVLAIFSVPPSSSKPVWADARKDEREGRVAERMLKHISAWVRTSIGAREKLYWGLRGVMERLMTRIMERGIELEEY
jgi:hypothetical protein